MLALHDFHEDGNHTLSHDFVDLAIFLAAHKLLVLVCKFDLDSDLVRRAIDERYRFDDHHSCFDSVVRAIDGECELLKADVGARVCADIAQHDADVIWRRRSDGRPLRWIWHHNPPRGTEELAGLLDTGQ